MKHKHSILILSVILVVLLVIKGNYEPLFFPMQTDLSESTQWSQKKMDKLIKYKTSQKFADIPWDEFSIGDYMEYVNSNGKHTTDSTVVFNETIIDSKIIKFFSTAGKLIEIDLYFKDAQLVKPDILSMYGTKYLKVDDSVFGSYNDYDSRFFWIKDSIIIIYEIGGTGDGGYLTIADMSNLSNEELKYLIQFGSISQYWKQKAHPQSFIEWWQTPKDYTPTTNIKKYGDSDTYQGSSKQKEDLEAIDKYFGL